MGSLKELRHQILEGPRLLRLNNSEEGVQSHKGRKLNVGSAFSKAHFKHGVKFFFIFKIIIRLVLEVGGHDTEGSILENRVGVL